MHAVHDNRPLGRIRAIIVKHVSLRAIHQEWRVYDSKSVYYPNEGYQ